MEMNYASRGVGNDGLTTSIIGTSLGALAALGGVGGVGNLFGVRNATDPQSVPVSRYDLEKEQQIAELKSQLALRDANTYGDQKALELYRYIDGRLQEITATLAAQAVNNQATKDTSSWSRSASSARRRSWARPSAGRLPRVSAGIIPSSIMLTRRFIPSRWPM